MNKFGSALKVASIFGLFLIQDAASNQIIKDWSKILVPQLQTGSLPYGLNVKVSIGPDGSFKTESAAGVASAIAWALPKNESSNMDLTHFVHPEMREDLPVGKWLRSRKSLGVSMSGGGMRAATCALGWLRALNSAGILNKARYISCNSGGSWVNLPLSAKDILTKKDSQVDLDFTKYLGDYVAPENVSLGKKELGIIGQILADANINREKNIDTKDTRFTGWISRIDNEYVKPFNISNTPDFYLDIGNAMLWNENPNRLSEKRFPFTICAGTAYPYPDSSKEVVQAFIPFEFTPLYCGVPINPKQVNDKLFTVEGGFTQSLSFNTEVKQAPPAQSTNGSYIVELPLPKKVLKVAEISGISSSAGAVSLVAGPEQMSGMMKAIKPFLPKQYSGLMDSAKYNFWSPTSGGPSQTFGFFDGCLYDNSGTIALLRRGCKTVICCVAVDSDVDNKNGVENTWYDFANLFGASTTTNFDEVVLSTYNEMNQVFERNKWDELIKEFREKVSSLCTLP